MSLKRHVDFLIGVPLVRLFALAQRERRAPAEFQKILIIKLAAVGDTVLLNHVLAVFHRAHPSIEIHWLVSPINRALAQLSPVVDRFWVWEGGVGALPSLIKIFREQYYDAVIDLEQWSRGTALLSYLSDAPVRLGFDTPGQHRAALFTRSYPKKFNQ